MKRQETKNGRWRLKGTGSRTVAHDHGSFLLNRFLGHAWGEIIGEKHRTLDGRDIEAQGCLSLLIHIAQKEADIVPSLVGQVFWVPNRMNASALGRYLPESFCLMNSQGPHGLHY